jgi:hypothetical protein
VPNDIDKDMRATSPGSELRIVFHDAFQRISSSGRLSHLANLASCFVTSTILLISLPLEENI